jgi:antitoxin YefM
MAHNLEVGVQIPPPLPRPEALSRTEKGPSACLVLMDLRTVADEASLTLPGFLVILLTMTVLPLGDVKSHLSELVGRVHDHHERVTVTVHGRPSAILIAPEDLEALEETLEIMRDAATMNRLAESDAELARGEYVSAEELAEAMRRRRAQ